MNSKHLVIATWAALAVAGIGCNSGSSDNVTEEQKKDPAWIQAKLQEMDKGLTPDKPEKPAKPASK